MYVQELQGLGQAIVEGRIFGLDQQVQCLNSVATVTNYQSRDCETVCNIIIVQSMLHW